MRTTINIDDDLLRQLKRQAQQSGVALRHLVNTALRRGITDPAPRSARPSYACPVFPMGVPRVNLDKALAAAAGLEDAEILRELELRK